MSERLVKTVDRGALLLDVGSYAPKWAVSSAVCQGCRRTIYFRQHGRERDMCNSCLGEKHPGRREFAATLAEIEAISQYRENKS